MWWEEVARMLWEEVVKGEVAVARLVPSLLFLLGWLIEPVRESSSIRRHFLLSYLSLSLRHDS
jgi:hypothetical protein